MFQIGASLDTFSARLLMVCARTVVSIAKACQRGCVEYLVLARAIARCCAKKEVNKEAWDA